MLLPSITAFDPDEWSTGREFDKLALQSVPFRRLI
jgi:hypothetical protein